jgi:peptide/nickel transport system substrate-binding protein
MDGKRTAVTRREFLALAGMAGAATVLQGAAAPGPKAGGSTTWAHEIQVTSLNPITAPEGSTNAFCEQAYDGLTAFDAKLNIVPALAESWETPNDTTYVFHLRKNVKWHDGTEFSAEDVKYTFEYILDPKNAVYWRANFDGVSRVEVVNKQTVRFLTKAPFPPLLGALAIRKNSAIVPKGAIERASTNMTMLGTGPFRQVEYVPGSHMKLARFKDYWGAPKPYIEELVYKLLLEEDARVAALRGGAIDYARISVEGRQRLKEIPDLAFTSTPGMRIIALKFNMNRKPWDDVRVRQAVNLAIDREEIIEKALSGAGSVSGPLPPVFGQWSISAADLKARWYKPNPERAKQLLKEAGYSPAKAADFMCAPWSPFDIPVATVVADQLARVGVQVKLRQVETGVFGKEENPPVINFDLNIGGFSARHDPDGYLWQRLYTEGGKNPFSNGYKNERLDALLSRARSTNAVDRRKEAYLEAQRIVLDEVPFAWLVVPEQIEAVRKRIQGFTPSPLESRAWGLLNAWIA